MRNRPRPLGVSTQEEDEKVTIGPIYEGEDLFSGGIMSGEAAAKSLFEEDDDPHKNLRRAVNTPPQAGPFDPPEITTGSPGRCGCADVPDLALAKETVGPVDVQIVYCDECEQVIEQVVGDG